MKNLLASTAAVIALSTAAFADGHTAAFSELKFDQTQNVNASEMIGARVYASEADIENNMIKAGQDKEWDDIGEINEIVLSRSGDVTNVIVGVGGFLGIGEKDVSISMDQLQFVTEEDGEDYFLVIKASVAGVKDAPTYTVMMSSDADMEEPKTDDAMADNDDDTMSVRTPLPTPTVERDGYKTVMVDDLTTEDLTGARVYGASDEDIGEVSELLLTNDGKLDRAVLDIGGFLGMGEHSIAVPMSELQIVREDDGDDVRVYIESSQEALEAQPEYEG